MNLRPLGNNVVVEKINSQDKTESGLYIPEIAKERPQTGKVVAVGTGEYINGEHVNLEVTVGNIILFTKYAGTEFKLDGNNFVIMQQKDILAILD
jgi:chaperonin GroES